MQTDYVGLVQDFCVKYQFPINDPAPDVIKSVWRGIQSELEELEEEVFDIFEGGEIDQENATKEINDVLFLVFKLAVVLGLNVEEAFQKVAESNLTKGEKDGSYKKVNGKLQKGAAYVPPDLSEFAK
jgi:NTP pyrophosphatase (non-canonical NTP hydrolase)